MKLFPSVLLTWREPVAFAYGYHFGAIWPEDWPLTGNLVKLCEDRITRSNGRSYVYIGFNSMDECAVSDRRDSEGKTFYVLTFREKVSLFRLLFGYLNETACDDLTKVNRIVQCLRDNGINVRDERA